MKYPQYTNLDFAKVGEDILAYWQANDIFAQSITSREGKPTFTFYEGPPSANGMPGIHHVMARTIKDIFCRYKTLRGFQVKRKGGWDTHGLPIELQVEKELGITKEDIGKKISIADYNRKCRETVMKYTHVWNDLTQKMGYWVDLDHPYVTCETPYIESVWHLLKQLHDQGLLYKGYTIQPYSPAAGTGLSSHELNQPGTYKEVKDTTVVAQFRVVRDAASRKLFDETTWNQTGNYAEPETFVLAWTTTPWTLPANTALAVGKNIPYVLVRTFNQYSRKPVQVILAKALMNSYFEGVQYTQEIFESWQRSPWGATPNEEQVANWLLRGDSSITTAQVYDYLNPPVTEVSRGLDYSKHPKAKNLWRVVAEFTGADLVGIRYERLFNFTPFEGEERAFRVIPGDFVTTEDGTGIVHISPTFGADDFRVAQQNDIPALLVPNDEGKLGPIVDRTGRYVPQMGEFGGRWVKNYDGHDQSGADYKTLDESIAIKMKGDGTAFKVEKYEHTYPHCWRTDKPILYYPLDSWFIRTTAKKDHLIALNNTINWKPESTGTKRFGNWLEGLVDWNLSRSRFWGTPLPIWRTDDGTEECCIGSVAELTAAVDQAVAAGLMAHNPLTANGEAFDLHRPYVDDLTLVSPTGRPMRREADLVDVWFDSGAMPYAQWHYPFENRDKIDGHTAFPADFISEGVDQTRGWFFTLHAIAGLLFDQVAFKNVVSTGLVLDKNGEKMAKRKGNIVNPFETMAAYGPDATRWYLIANAPPWDNLKFDLAGVQEVQRKFFGTLQNTYHFFALYANIDGFDASQSAGSATDLTESDRWILSRLHSLVGTVGRAYEDYEPTRAARALQDFVADDLSNWYVRLNRKRFWKGQPADKLAAYQTLHTCLETTARLISPIAPFYAEQLYLDLTGSRATGSRATGEVSVHLSDFPAVDASAVDAGLEAKMGLAQSISSLIHGLRKKHALKVRQPLARVLVPVADADTEAQIRAVEDLILAEVNVKAIQYMHDTSGVVIKKIKPNFKALGPRFGKNMQHVAAVVNSFSQANIADLERSGFVEFTVEDTLVTLRREDVDITSEDIPGWIVASENGTTVALDITLTDELRREGIARDVVNRVQNLRKDLGLDVLDRITLAVQQSPDPLVNAALAEYCDYICQETQANALELLPHLAQGKDVELDDFTLRLRVARVEN